MFAITQNNKILFRRNIIRCLSVSNIHPTADTTMTAGSIKPFKEIPGPSSLPLLGPMHNFLPGGTLYNLDRSDMFAKLLQMYGPIVRLDKVANLPDTVLLFDADSISTVLRSEESAPRRSLVGTLEMYRQKYNKPEIGVLVNGSGQEWKNVRSPVNKAMMNPKLVFASYFEIINEIAKDFVKRFQSICDEEGKIANFNEEIKLWALETTGAVTFGRRLNSFNRELSEDSHEKRLINLIQSTFEIIEALDFEHNVLPKYFSPYYWKSMKTFRELESVILHFLEQSMETWKSKAGNGISDEIHACTVEKILYKNKNAAVGVSIDSMIAGVDAVSQAMTILLYFLGSHPEKQRKLREEILSGKDKMPYLKACMKESARLIPTAFANARVTTKSHEVMGYKIPKDTLVVVPQRIVSTMESHYPRATEFIPERWLVEEHHPLYYGKAHPFTYMPFGYGIRTCIGRRLVYVMMEALAANMIKNFEISWKGPPPKVILKAFNKLEPPYGFIFKSLH